MRRPHNKPSRVGMYDTASRKTNWNVWLDGLGLIYTYDSNKIALMLIRKKKQRELLKVIHWPGNDVSVGD